MTYRISGHESFPCRYAWLPKAVRGLARNPRLFADDDSAMVDLGVGKNMARSIRFWMLASKMARTGPKGEGHLLTEVGKQLLGKDGLDPFMEDIRTLWLIHWNLSTDVDTPLLAWDFLLNRWQEPELLPSAVIKALHSEAARKEERLSLVTIEHHFEAFLHSYISTRGRKGEVLEDNLDCPLVELELLVRVGERLGEQGMGRAEPIFAFRREEKPEISGELFVYCLNDFWNRNHPAESTLSFREIAHGHGSPGQIFKLPEDDVRRRVEQLERKTASFLAYTESAHLQQVQRFRPRNARELLREIYKKDVTNG